MLKWVSEGNGENHITFELNVRSTVYTELASQKICSSAIAVV